MRRHGKPSRAATGPHIGIAPLSLFAVRGVVAGAGVNDGNIAEQADPDILRDKEADRHRLCCLCQELSLVEKRAVRVRAQEIVGQNVLEALYVALLNRCDVIAVQRNQRVMIALHGGVGLHWRSPDGDASAILTRPPTTEMPQRYREGWP